MCFGIKYGVLAIGSYDRRFQQGEMLWTVQRENELGYTYDVYDMRLKNETFADWKVEQNEISEFLEAADSRGNKD